MNNKKIKPSYNLVPPYAYEQVAKVFTYHRVDIEAMLNDSKWTTLIEELEYHFQEFKSGKDLCDFNLYHLAHCAQIAMVLIAKYRISPDTDDRYKSFMNTRKIVLDVDDVVADFAGAYSDKFNVLPGKYWDSSYSLVSNLDKMIKNGDEGKDFYVNLPVKHIPNFIPHAYVSSRSVPVEWTKEFLEKNNLPCRPVYHVPFNESKIEVLKSLGDDIVFIDDKIENFIEAEKAGITAFLMDAEHNRYFDVGYKRLYNLDINSIIR